MRRMDISNSTGEVDSRDKPTSPTGRADDQNDQADAGPDGMSKGYYPPQKAGVVIRATIEHIGLVGDAELTVNVKWPASTFCVQPVGKPAAPTAQVLGPQQVPGNNPQADIGMLYGESITDPKSEGKS